MKKIKYFYNTHTLRYEKLITPLRVKLLRVFAFLATAFVTSAIIAYFAFQFVGSPAEKLLRVQNAELQDRYVQLNREVKDIELKMAELEKRDNEVYRSIFEAAPIPDSARASTMEQRAEVAKVEGMGNNELLLSLYGSLTNLSKRIQAQQKSYKEVAMLVKNKEQLLAATPAIQPVSNKDLNRIASGFGYRIDPVYKTVKMHAGLDFTAPQGTPIYATADGRIKVGDVGAFFLPSPPGEGPGVRLTVIDTKKENDLIIHFTEQLPESISGTVQAAVDKNVRAATEAHHSATHLLHAALRHVLGNHVAQKGSLVNAQYLRFDFSHFGKMSPEEITQVEALVNEKIRANVAVQTEQLPKEEALARGAMALFGEKYGDTVRVVTMDPKYSVELCGGTHVPRTGTIGFFKIVSEGAVAAGVRRIEAVAGKAAEQFVYEQLAQLSLTKEVLKNPKDLVKAVQSLTDETARQRKELERWEEKSLQQQQQSLLPFAHQKAGYQLLTEVVEVTSADALKRLAHNLSVALGSAVVTLSAVIGDRLQVAIAITPNLVSEKGLDANKLVKEVAAPVIKGGGGGQKGLATGSGNAADAAHAVLKAVQAALPAA